MRKAENRLVNLDILRLVSAGMVIAAHYGFRMHVTGEGGGVSFPEIAPLSIWFEAAIFVFFMISGYVIPMSATGRTAYEFFSSRAARVWPTFLVCATLTAIILSFWNVPGLDAPTVKQWMAHIFVVPRIFGQPFLDGAYWTIVCELVFYTWVFLLLVARWFDTRWREVMVTWLVISLLNEMVIGSRLIEFLFITKYSGCFMFGWALYRNQISPTRTGIAVLVLTAMWAIMTPVLMEPNITKFYGVSRDLIALVALGVAAILIMLMGVLAPALSLNGRVVTTLAAMTYPLYLLHQNIGYAIFNRFGTEIGRWTLLVIVLAVIFSASWLVSTYVEPFCRVRLQKLFRMGNVAAKASSQSSLART